MRTESSDASSAPPLSRPRLQALYDIVQKGTISIVGGGWSGEGREHGGYQYETTIDGRSRRFARKMIDELIEQGYLVKDVFEGWSELQVGPTDKARAAIVGFEPTPRKEPEPASEPTAFDYAYSLTTFMGWGQLPDRMPRPDDHEVRALAWDEAVRLGWLTADGQLTDEGRNPNRLRTRTAERSV